MLPSAVPAPDTRLFNRATMSAAVLALAIFVIDAVTPRGSGVGLLYVLPLLVGTFGGPPRFQYLAAFVVSLLAIVGLMVAPSGAPGNPPVHDPDDCSARHLDDGHRPGAVPAHVGGAADAHPESANKDERPGGRQLCT